MKYTRNNLKKLEDLCAELSYKVRYEQGHFQSGYCIVSSRNIIVINKFFDLEGRMNCILDLLPELKIQLEDISDETKSLYYKAISLRSLQESVV
ncbi:MAG: hypothetical protein IPO78_09560 [Saprospiraceae bacterium]|nr:hypothetical protein [Saprospiraceae bacterium]MBK8450133.1 hypothetical protein [Saprospiraceae bacterium]MBK8483770.1 hypothetical protein [Saprospiraceae bacterium]MBK9221222.1 hypothetical protein [Saprospiraceae bacterium]MBK9721843.1 hypothetical protein [Saprospiraceae bacterium]